MAETHWKTRNWLPWLRVVEKERHHNTLWPWNVVFTLLFYVRLNICPRPAVTKPSSASPRHPPTQLPSNSHLHSLHIRKKGFTATLLPCLIIIDFIIWIPSAIEWHLFSRYWNIIFHFANRREMMDEKQNFFFLPIFPILLYKKPCKDAFTWRRHASEVMTVWCLAPCRRFNLTTT